MKCPSCGYLDSKVVDSRPTEDSSIRRRRECLECHRRFTTYEIIDEVPVFVIKKSGSKEIFDPNKIIGGLRRSCYKRPVTEEQMTAMVSEIEADISNSLKSEITSAELGNMVMEKLKLIDEVSYVRFASVYREFKDVSTLLKELKLVADTEEASDENGDDGEASEEGAETETEETETDSSAEEEESGHEQADASAEQ